jgi:hypothetical protein
LSTSSGDPSSDCLNCTKPGHCDGNDYFDDYYEGYVGLGIHNATINAHTTAIAVHDALHVEHATAVAEHATAIAVHDALHVEHATAVAEHATAIAALHAEHATAIAVHAALHVEHATAVAEFATTIAAMNARLVQLENMITAQNMTILEHNVANL